ncbi:MAG: hypothetical protein QHH13_12905 [Melioribacter sp.]|uniref:lipoate--protein ligase family protein n=1 Tax=Rosettibacter primus TaxID=3111523 RepID=UPI00247C3B7C|nr:hypothetical protein [Melioribacter sp.]
MRWFFIDTGESTGKFNMDFDFQLAQTCPDDNAYFRLYRWKPFCISLGAHQKFEDINLEKAFSDGLDVVKRPTGGRAILHAEEITYSVILPFSKIRSAKEVYQKISLALIEGLKLYHPVFSKLELENLQPDFSKLLKEPSGILCFGTAAKNEVKFNGRKLIGSAQRKLNNAILQHGSILCGKYHRNLVDYINIDENTKSLIKNDIYQKTIEIETILGKHVDYKKLSECLIDGFKKVWNIEIEKSEINFSVLK